MISVVLCKVSQPSLWKQKCCDGKSVISQGSCVNDGTALSLKKKSGKSESLRVHFTDMNHEIVDKLMLGFQKNWMLFACYVGELSIHVHCMWLASWKSK